VTGLDFAADVFALLRPLLAVVIWSPLGVIGGVALLFAWSVAAVEYRRGARRV
jgi:hypothetical protein